jgi:MFS transporter, DHA2 family, multidrug resistance protein
VASWVESPAWISPASSRSSRYAAQARLEAAGVANPKTAAMSELVMRAKLEATVMTYNNLFVTLSMSFVLVMLVVALLDHQKPVAPQPSH